MTSGHSRGVITSPVCGPRSSTRSCDSTRPTPFSRSGSAAARSCMCCRTRPTARSPRSACAIARRSPRRSAWCSATAASSSATSGPIGGHPRKSLSRSSAERVPWRHRCARWCMVSATVPVTQAAAPNLTRRASLNAAQALLDYTARLVVGLVTMPILVRGLGQSLFGTWQVLGQLLGYLSATDGRPTDALRLGVAHRAAGDEEGEMRRHVGSALVVWLLFLPIAATAGGILIWLAPRLTKVGPDFAAVVRLAAGLLFLQFLLATLSAVPESVLRGANLGYKRMGLQSGLQILGGLLAVGAVTLGLGLGGLGFAQSLLPAVRALCYGRLASRYVRWFGVARPGRPE